MRRFCPRNLQASRANHTAHCTSASHRKFRSPCRSCRQCCCRRSRRPGRRWGAPPPRSAARSAAAAPGTRAPPASGTGLQQGARHRGVGGVVGVLLALQALDTGGCCCPAVVYPSCVIQLHRQPAKPKASGLETQNPRRCRGPTCGRHGAVTQLVAHIEGHLGRGRGRLPRLQFACRNTASADCTYTHTRFHMMALHMRKAAERALRLHQ
jgi:hypothetical protein